jgi:hypothetical protein
VHYFTPDATADVVAAQIEAVLGQAGPAALRRRVLRDYNWEAIYQTGLLPLFGR